MRADNSMSVAEFLSVLFERRSARTSVCPCVLVRFVGKVAHWPHSMVWPFSLCAHFGVYIASGAVCVSVGVLTIAGCAAADRQVGLAGPTTKPTPVVRYAVWFLIAAAFITFVVYAGQ